MIPAFLAPIAARFAAKRVGNAIKRIPAWAWIALAVAAIIVGGIIWHQHTAHAAIAAAEKRGEDRAYARVAEQARKLEQRANAASSKIASTLRSKNDETNLRIVRDADAQLLRGPGKAAYRSCPAAPAGASGHVAADRPADAAVDQMPDGERPDLIVMPFADAIAFAEQHDLNRAEALSWREGDRKQRAAWPTSTPSQPQEQKP